METPFLSLWPFLNPLLLLPFSKTNTQPTHVAEEEENDLLHNIGLFFSFDLTDSHSLSWSRITRLLNMATALCVFFVNLVSSPSIPASSRGK